MLCFQRKGIPKGECIEATSTVKEGKICVARTSDLLDLPCMDHRRACKDSSSTDVPQKQQSCDEKDSPRQRLVLVTL